MTTLPPITLQPGDSITVSAAAPVVPPQPSGTPVPPSIDPTGTTDVTSAFQTFLDAAKGTIIFPRGSLYFVKGLTGHSGQDLYAPDGGGFKQLGYASSILYFPNCAAPSVRGGGLGKEFALVGGNPDGGKYVPYRGGPPGADPSQAHGIRFGGCTKPVAHFIKAQNVYGDGIFLASTNNGTIWNDGADIADVIVDGAGRNALTVNAARNSHVTRLTGSRIQLFFVDLEPDYAAEGIDGLAMSGLHALGYGYCTTYAPFYFSATSKAGSVLRNITLDSSSADGNVAGYLSQAVGLNIQVAHTTTRASGIAMTNLTCPKSATPSWRGGVLSFDGIDGLTLTSINQPTPDPNHLYSITDCTAVTKA